MGHGPALVYTSGIHLKSHVGRRRNEGDAGGRQTQLCTSVTLRTVGLQLWENVLFQLCDQCFPLLRCDTVFSLKHRDIRRRLVVLISIYAPPTLLHLLSSTPRPQPTSWASKRVLLQTRRADPSRGTATLTHYRTFSLLILPFFSLKDKDGERSLDFPC